MPHTPSRDEQLAAFYAAHADRLHRAVRGRVRGSGQTIEDACQNAWTILLRRPDIALDRIGFGWLIVVAVREAWRLAAPGREQPTGALRGEPLINAGQNIPDLPDSTAERPDERALDYVEQTQRLQALKPREREALYLKALGYSYREIADLTGSTYTAVNRRLTEGRRALRGEHRKTGRPRQP